jgi:hypothetical protein
MPLQTFYQTVAQLCFTLLGLWWLVLQTKYREWIGDRTQRRTITNISLYFLLPGTMSLMALLATQTPLLWQVSFFVASGLGAFESAGAFVGRAHEPAMSRLARTMRLVGLLLYLLVALVAVIAFIPGAAHAIGLVPLTTAGFLVTLIVVLGVILAWAYFIQVPEESKG